MSVNTSQIVGWPTELKVTMTGSTISIGTLLHNPTLIIFDNQGTVPISIYVNGTAAENLWKTFPGGEGLVMDWRDKAHLAANYTASIGTTFYGNGASGDFSISYVYAAGSGG